MLYLIYVGLLSKVFIQNMTVITDSEELKKICSELSQEPFITVDTEFIRDTTYYPKLCLVQIAGKERVIAVDSLQKKMDFQPLYDLMCNPDVVKVFHSARQDIEIFYAKIGAIPTPIFDTQVAAMVCGFGDAASYHSLVKRFCEASLDKSARFTNWAKRPLSAKQLSYALSDVTYLRDIYAKIIEKIQEDNRDSWIKEEMQALCNPENYSVEPEYAWKKIKTKSHSTEFLMAVKSLAAWRECLAQERNVPRNRIMKDPLILEIAATQPKSVEELRHVRSLSKSILKNGLAQEIVDLLQAVPKHSPDEDVYAFVASLSKQDTFGSNAPTVEMLKLLLKTLSLQKHVAEKLIASVSDLRILAREGRNAKIPALHGWRYEVFGSIACDLIEGKVALAVEHNQVKITQI